jgi:hypothetical protein
VVSSWICWQVANSQSAHDCWDRKVHVGILRVSCRIGNGRQEVVAVTLDTGYLGCMKVSAGERELCESRWPVLVCYQ